MLDRKHISSHAASALIAAALGLAPQPAHADKDKDVTVINTSANPVPVVPQGVTPVSGTVAITGAVGVAGMIGIDPALNTVTVAASREPVVHVQQALCDFLSCAQSYVVPFGKRLVVEQVYLTLTVQEGSVLQVSLNVLSSADFSSFVSIPVLATKQGTGNLGYISGNSDVYVASAATRVYGGSPTGGFATQVWVTSHLTPSDGYQGVNYPVIVGYLVPLP